MAFKVGTLAAISLAEISWTLCQTQRGEVAILGDVKGVIISINISMHSRPTRCEARAYCQQGQIELNLFHDYALIEKGAPSRRQKLQQPIKHYGHGLFTAIFNLIKRAYRKEYAYPGLHNLIKHFYQAVITSHSPPISRQEIQDIAVARDNINLARER